MKCNLCKTNIASGPEATKMIVQYVQDDGGYKFFGYMMEDGPLTQATGRITRAWHHKCFHVVRKREARGDAVTGRVLSGLPGVYELDITHSTADLSVRMAELHAIAREVGKPVGDPAVHEAYQARQHGGPYRHKHDLPMEVYQLRPHLHFAHGVAMAEILTLNMRARHARLHDDAELFPDQRDWRDHTVVDVEELKEAHHD